MQTRPCFLEKGIHLSVLTGLTFLTLLCCHAQEADFYRSLDPNDPIEFGGDHIIYKGQNIDLGPRAFFIDGQLTEEEAGKYPYVFNSVNEAAKHLTDGTEADPMVLYTAPWVYWIDDPDDPAIRMPESGGTPYGLVIDCEWLRFYGLTEDPENVVLACNRGQTIGARGNFTMFRFSGQGTSSENITFGNYCNVDLNFPLKPELGREKRASAIVQAQLIHCNGDKIVARNTRFISRLNLCPFVGGQRVLFDHCHFESTDDALCATGVYLDCTFDFYSSKPFYWTRGTGSVLLNCDITSYTRGEQYFTKANGQLAVADTRFHSQTLSYIGWRDIPPPEMRNYQYDVSLNDEPVIIGSHDPYATVVMKGKPVLNAYRFEYNGEVVYNTYNLLCGDDDWDPLHLKNLVLEAEKVKGEKLTGLPVQLLLSPTAINLETGKDTTTLTVTVNRFGNFEMAGERIVWEIDHRSGFLVEMKVHEDSMACDIVPTNNTDETGQVIIKASTPSGLEAASVINVAPTKLDPPEFIAPPELKMHREGKIVLDYKLDMRFKDQSLITWYRCSDIGCSNPIEVAVSRFDQPLLEYELKPGDVGYFIMATVRPKHQRSDPGEAVSVIMKDPIVFEDIRTDPNTLETDFMNISTKDQPEVIPGFWTFYSFEPDITGRQRTANKNIDAWYYGEGSGGSAGYTGLLQSQYARMFYTPVGTSFGDMKLTMTVVPFKTAGQGFSVAPLYMDVLIKFDAKTFTGYGLRFIRTTKYGNAVDCYFVKYEAGKVIPISDPVSTSCYRPVCNITLQVSGNRLIALAVTDPPYKEVPDRPEVVEEVKMETVIDPISFGGFGIEYAGGATSLIRDIRVEWK